MKPNEINQHFLSIASGSNVNNEILNYYNNNKLNDGKFCMKHINNEDIYKSLKSIKSEAYGVDDINTKMINIVLPYCIDLVRNLFNASITQGIFPNIWKSADVIPLPKTLHPASYNDLRPISILPAFAKLLEKIIAFEVKNYLDTKQILPLIQSGFRKNHSTNTALLKVVDDIATAFDKSFTTILILLDQSKAFDLVNFDLLLAKLSFIGFDATILAWFFDYLHGRSQRVKINKVTYSEFGFTNSGVPQGSILGPILFSIFTFDLPDAVKYSQIHLYADDLQMYNTCNVTNANEIINLVNLDLKNIVDWCDRNGLKVNPSKTVALCIGPDCQRDEICNNQLEINNSTIEWVASAKNLGLFLDNKLCFNDHVNHIVKVSFFKLKSLYHLKHQISENTKLRLIKSLIYPHIDYCCMVYYNFLPNYNQHKLQRIQNACFRFVCNVPYGNHISPSIHRLSEMRINNRVKYLYLLFLYKLLSHKIPTYLLNMLLRRSSVHNINVRLNSFTIPQHSSTKFEGCFSYNAPCLLNTVLNEINLSHGAFIKHIKQALLFTNM